MKVLVTGANGFIGQALCRENGLYTNALLLALKLPIRLLELIR